MKRNRSKVLCNLRAPVASAVAVLLLTDAPLTAAAIFKELSENELAEMRGKFVVGRNIEYFGMSVSTQWTRETALADRDSVGIDDSRIARSGPGQAAQGPQAPGTTHEVRLDLQVDNSGPDTKVAYSVEGTLGNQVSNSPPPAPNPAVSQIDGVTQAIQVAGSDNFVENHVRYSVMPTGTAPVLTDAQTTTATPVDQTFVNGDVVTHVTASNGLGFTITSQGNQITQQLGMNPVTNTSQLLQSVQLKANGHRIVNDLMLQVAFDNAVTQRDSLRFRADRVMSQL